MSPIAIQNELYKLIHKKKYIVMLVLGMLVCLIRWGGSALIAKISGGSVVLKSNMTLEMLPFVIEILVPVIIFMAVTDLFCSEISDDTMKTCLLKPFTRLKVMTAKASAAWILGSVSAVLMFVICAVVQIMSGSSIKDIGLTFTAYLLDIIPLIGIVLLGVFINVCLKNPSAVMLLLLVIYAVMKYMGAYVAGSDSFLFTSYAKWHNLFLGAGMPFNVIIYKIGILAGSILILFSFSYIIFDRKDI